MNENILILEHDARFIKKREPFLRFYDGVLSIGKPSYGKYFIPRKEGINPLTSKRYLPGAHAYLVSPFAADQMIREARNGIPRPTDVFIHTQTFPWIQEYYPWFVEVEDTFTTVQSKEKGCKSKHAFRLNEKNYKIIDVE